ncbi:MAG: septum formation initiator family protein, partial [Rhodobacter sp.]|nr:septum formation initiator family protein [Rhodobacter sp.]
MGAAVYFMIIFTLGSYFTFAAVQGDYGVFRRVQIDAEAE